MSTDPDQPFDPRGDSPYTRYPAAPPPPEAAYGYPGPYGAPGQPPPGMPPFAGWLRRVGAWLVDNFVVGFVFGLVAPAVNSGAVEVVGGVAALVWAVYNAVLAGRTGQSYGKRALGIRLARLADGQPVGAGRGLLRWVLNLVFSWAFLLPGLLNYLWPLWDRASQTWSDKIARSVVVRV